jgi:hypothetical protein
MATITRRGAAKTQENLLNIQTDQIPDSRAGYSVLMSGNHIK